eukprot:6786517-Alexandrium_andersonii.AAC.1
MDCAGEGRLVPPGVRGGSGDLRYQDPGPPPHQNGEGRECVHQCVVFSIGSGALSGVGQLSRWPVGGA